MPTRSARSTPSPRSTTTAPSRPPTTRAAGGNWLRWEECELATASLWDQLAPDLPDDLVRFLTCFDGIQGIALKREVADTILRKLPDLHERVAAIAGTSDGAAMLTTNRPRPLDLGSHTE